MNFLFTQKDENWKTKAVDVVKEGVVPIASKDIVNPRKSYPKENIRKSSRLVSVVLILAFGIGATFYLPFFSCKGSAVKRVTSNTVQTSSRYTCAGKNRCDQMTSCEEAMLYLQNCPGMMMDGNEDGIPWRGSIVIEQRHGVHITVNSRHIWFVQVCATSWTMVVERLRSHYSAVYKRHKKKSLTASYRC